MTKRNFIIMLAGLLGIYSCNQKITSTKNSQQMTVTVQTMKDVLDAFNRHDLDAIMEYFSDDCSFDFPRGPDPWGQRFVGKANVREGLAMRFKGIPDVHYGDDRHWISADGTQGVSEWTQPWPASYKVNKALTV